jgi:uncharacterized protein YhfF
MERPEDFWARCCAALGPEPADRGFTVRRIGNTPELVDQLLGLIIAGDKRGTFSLPDALERNGTRPRAGDYLVLTRHNGAAGCLVQVETCDLVAFDQIGPAELAIEGPDARDPAAWRDVHERYWTPMLAAWGQHLAPDQPVLVQRVRLLATAES